MSIIHLFKNKRGIYGFQVMIFTAIVAAFTTAGTLSLHLDLICKNEAYINTDLINTSSL